MKKKINSKHTFYNVELPDNWEIRTIDSIKAQEKYSCAAGPFGSNISAKFFVDQGVPVIRGCNLSLGQESFIAEDFVFITEDKANSFPGQQVKTGDLVFTCWGTLGQVGLIPANGLYDKYVISNKQLKLRPNSNICNSKYIYYYFSLPQMIQYINNIAIGSAVPGINLGLLKKIKVVLPPIEIQNKIAAILSAYDDLIENNKRRIALLENMAEEIYREWFVRFRFPGYQQAKFEKGIPEDWSLDSLEKFCLKVTDGTHDTPKPVEDGHYLVTGKNIKNGQVNFDGAYKISKNDHLAISKRSGLKEWDILFSNIGTLGATAIVSANPDYSVKNVIIFKPKSANQSLFLSLVLRNPAVVEHLHLISSGASQQFIGLGVARSFKILNPGDELINNFGEKVLLVQKQILKLNEINQILQSNKEMLLSRLISGKLSVENLDIKFPPSML